MARIVQTTQELENWDAVSFPCQEENYVENFAYKKGVLIDWCRGKIAP